MSKKLLEDESELIEDVKQEIKEKPNVIQLRGRTVERKNPVKKPKYLKMAQSTLPKKLEDMTMDEMKEAIEKLCETLADKDNELTRANQDRYDLEIDGRKLAQNLTTAEALLKDKETHIQTLVDAIARQPVPQPLAQPVAQPAAQPAAPAPPKIKTINPSQPTFAGKVEENIDNWIFTTEVNLNVANVTDNDKPTYASTYLRDVALQYYRQISAQAVPPWIDFKRLMKRQFQSANYNEVLLDQLDKLQMTGPVAAHIQKFMYLINQTENLTEPTKIHMFRKTLSPPLSAELRYRKPATLTDACNMAVEFEDSYLKANVVKVDHSSEINLTNYRTRRQSFKRCNICNRFGHWSAECRLQQQPNTRGYKPPRRFVETNEPRKFPVRNEQKKPIINTNVPRGPQLVKHKKSEVNTISVTDFVTTTALIEDRNVNVLFDTGAKQSVIAYRDVKRYNFPYHHTNAVCSLGNGSTDTIMGVTDPLRVIICGSICELEFIILPRQNTLLGLDWFNTVKAHVETYDNTLVFAKRAIPLSLNEENKNTIEEINLSEVNVLEVEDTNEKEEIYEPWSSIKTTLPTPQLSQLDEEQNCKFKQLVTTYSDLIASSYHDLAEPCKIQKFKIITVSEQPIRIPPYRKSLSERELLKKEILEMLEAKIIRPSSSPWSFPVVMIPKPDGTTRFCVDYRKLNSITQQDPFPLPRIDDIFDRLNGSKWFTAIDLKAGYWQIEMEETSIPKTAFSTPDGHYEFTRLPFGLKNAPAVFSRIMFQVLGNLPFVEIYLDDITIHSKTIELHLQHIKAVFVRLREVSLKINIKKCKWFQPTIHLLGHILDGTTIKMDPAKISTISNWKAPENILQIQQFLGLCGYYRRFIKDFSKIAAPLFNLLKKQVTWKWDDSCEKAFKELKLKLTTYPILQQPDFAQPFILQTDASGIAIGAILSQKDENGREYVCAYASRILQGAEIHYGITEKECLAIIWAIKHFRIYLYGRKFTIITDHSALQWLINLKDPTGRLARWSIYIQAFDFEIKHRSGKSHANVDALSRLAQDTPTNINLVEMDTTSKSLDVWEDENLKEYLKTGILPSGISKKLCNRLQLQKKQYMMDGDVIKYRKNIEDDYLVVPKPAERQEIIKTAHLLGHFAIGSVYDRLRTKYFWKNMIKDIENVVKQCRPCLRHQKTPIQEHPALAIPVTGLMDRIDMDLVFGLPETENGYKGIFVITEALSKYPYAVPIKSKTALEIARQFFNFICLFGPPKQIISDQGKEFVNSILQELVKLTGIEHRITSAYHPRTNGMTERFNQTLINSLKKHTENEPQEWDKWIPYVLLAYRTKINSVTNYTPYEIMFGREMIEFKKWNTEPSEEEAFALYKRSVEIKKMYEYEIPKVRETIKEVQEGQMKRQNQQHNIEDTTLAIGSKVFLKDPQLLNKLEARYQGPFTITGLTKHQNYWLSNNQGKRLKHSYPLSRLKIVSNKVEDENVYEVEKIINERVRNGTKEYLVKWKDYPDNDNTWVKESDMSAPEIIEEYKRSKYTNFDINHVNCFQINKPNILLIIFILAKLIANGRTMTINGTFQYCEPIKPHQILDLNSMCTSEPSQEITVRKNITVLGKRLFDVDGEAYLCYRKTLTIKTYKSFFGHETFETDEQIHRLSRIECLELIITKHCINHYMECIGDNCQSPPYTYYSFNWLRHQKFTDHKCFIKKINIKGYTNKKIFSNAISRCHGSDLNCEMNQYIIIWEKKIISTCPYYPITTRLMNHTNNIIEGNNLIFQITNHTQECNTSIMHTQEGLFLTDSNQFTPPQVTDISSEVKTQLIIADMDYTNFRMYNNIANYITQLDGQTCKLLKLIMYNNIEHNNIYLKLKMSKQHEIIILNKHGKYILNKCYNVNKIKIELNQSRALCTNNIWVQFNVNNTDRKAYLFNNGIISMINKKQECKKPVIITLPNNNQLIKINNTLKFINNSNNLIQFKYNFINISKWITNHSKEITESYSTEPEIQNAMDTMIIDTKNLIEAQDDSLIKQIYTSINLYNNFIYYFKIIIISIIMLVMTLLCSCFIKQIIKVCKR